MPLTKSTGYGISSTGTLQWITPAAARWGTGKQGYFEPAAGARDNAGNMPHQ